MAANELTLFTDIDQGRLVQGFLSTVQSPLPRFVIGDSIPISFRPLTSNDGENPWRDFDLTGKTVRMAIGNLVDSPIGGEFTISYGGGTTAAISHDATAGAIQSALNALAAITSAGGVTVTKSAGGVIRIVFDTNGNRTALTCDVTALTPAAGAGIFVAIEGSVSVREVVVIRLESLPASYAELTTSFPAASATVTVIREGSVTAGEIQTLAFPVLPYSGFYSIAHGADASASIQWDAGAATLQAALVGIPSIGAGKVIVSGAFPKFTISFDVTLGNVNALTCDVSGLTVPRGRSGLLSTNTSGIVELLNGAAQTTAKLEIEIYDIADATTWTILQTDCVIADAVIFGIPIISPTGPVYVTLETLEGLGVGASTYAALTDKATADLPTINTPLANALSGKIATGGNAGTVTNIGDLTGVVTSTNRETAIADGAITNAMLTAPLSAFSSGLAYNGITVTLTPPGGDLAITGGIYATGGIQAIGNISTAQITVTGGGSVAENFSVGGILSATSFVGPLTGQADVATSAIAGAEGFTLSIGGAPDVVVGNTNNRFFDAYGSAISASYAISANYANYADNAGIANTAYAADAANSAGIAYYANYADSSSDFNTFFYGMYPNTSFGADGAASFAGGKIAFTADGQAGFRDGSTFGKGVQGYSENGRGVQGQSSTQIGIYGESATGTGVFAISYSGFGFRCRSNFGVPMRLENASGPVLIVANNGRLTTGYTIQLKGYTVATLPSGLAGDTAYVTDALTPAFMAVLVGGGAVVTKAFFNGSNWTAQ